MDWISVKDRLPEDCVDVLLVVYDGLGTHVSHGYYYSKGEHTKWRECSRNLISVTHWHPQLELPGDEPKRISHFCSCKTCMSTPFETDNQIALLKCEEFVADCKHTLDLWSLKAWLHKEDKDVDR